MTYNSICIIGNNSYSLLEECPPEQMKNEGEDITISSIIPTLLDTKGYEFLGWSTALQNANVEYLPGDTYSLDEDVTLYAIFRLVTYTVHLDANGGTVSPDSIGVLYNNKYGDLPTPVRHGYEFMGWFTDPSAGTIVTSETYMRLDSDHTLYAHWERISAETYTVRYISTAELTADIWEDYDYPGPVELGNIPSAQIKYPGVDLVLSSLVPTVGVEGFEFKKWIDSNGEPIYPDDGIYVYTGDEDLTLYPVVSGKWYDVVFDSNGGFYSNWETVSVVSLQYGYAYNWTLEAPTREGYVFTGWFTDPEAGTQILKNETFVTTANDHILYAHWNSEASVTDAAISVESIKASPGSQITVPVTISNNPGIIYMEFTVSYDDAVLEWTGVTQGEFGGQYDLSVGYPITWIGSDPRTDMAEDGIIAYLTFNVKADAPNGSTVSL